MRLGGRVEERQAACEQLDGWGQALSPFLSKANAVTMCPPSTYKHGNHTSAESLCVRLCYARALGACLKNLNKETQQK